MRGPAQTRYKYHLEILDTCVLEARLRHRLFKERKTAFNINLSYSYILRHKHTDPFTYVHSSPNCCGLYLKEPSLITNRDDFDAFLERIQQPDVLQWAVTQPQDSAWVTPRSVASTTRRPTSGVDSPVGCGNRSIFIAPPARRTTNKR